MDRHHLRELIHRLHLKQVQKKTESPSQKVYETDEYVDTDGGSGIPDAVPGDPNAPELPAADPGGDTEAGAQLPSANESSSEAGNSQEGSSENSTENSTEEETSQSQSE